VVSPEQRPPSVDDLLLRSITRWAVGIAALIVLFDVAVTQGYPFPLASHVIRGVFYAAAAVALLLAAAFTTFLGYRIVTTGFARGKLPVFMVFLPAVACVSSVIAALFLAAPS
jgi:uncharacterized membrane protein